MHLRFLTSLTPAPAGFETVPMDRKHLFSGRVAVLLGDPSDAESVLRSFGDRMQGCLVVFEEPASFRRVGRDLWLLSLSPQQLPFARLIVEQFLELLGERDQLAQQTTEQEVDLARFRSDLVSTREDYNKTIDNLARKVSEITTLNAELRESEARFRAIFEGSTDAILLLDEDGVFFDCNGRAVEVFGLRSREALVGLRSADLSSPDLPDGRSAALAATDAIRTALLQGHLRFEWLSRRMDGKEFPSEVLLSSFELGGRRVLQATVHDIGQRKRAEQEVRESESRFRALFEQAADPILVHDFQGRCLDANRQACLSLGYSRQELLAMEIQDVDVDARARPPTIASCLERREDGRATFESRYRRKDGSEFPVEVSLCQLDLRGRPVVLAQARDITDRKRVERERAELLRLEKHAREQAESANRSKDDFLAVLSHEMRTPLTPILCWSRMLRTMQPTTENACHAADVIERNARIQARLVEDMLDLSSIIAGKLRLDPRSIDLVATIGSVVESMVPQADAAQVHLTRQFEVRSLGVVADPDRLQQVVWNLISNALKFTPPDGRVEVRLRREADGGSALSVSDSGEGIRAEQLPRLFDRFWQADSSRNRRHRGLGLGLSLVRHLVELHGGSVEASSPGKGRGSTFVVRLPPHPPAERSANAPVVRRASLATAAPARCLGGKRVLIVEDERDTREVLVQTLRDHGGQIEQAETAGKALDVLEWFHPDVLLADVGRPGVDGVALISAVRSRGRERGGAVPAVALTANTRESDRRRVLEAGFQRQIAKPFDPEELAHIVSELVFR